MMKRMRSSQGIERSENAGDHTTREGVESAVEAERGVGDVVTRMTTRSGVQSGGGDQDLGHENETAGMNIATMGGGMSIEGVTVDRAVAHVPATGDGDRGVVTENRSGNLHDE